MFKLVITRDGVRVIGMLYENEVHVVTFERGKLADVIIAAANDAESMGGTIDEVTMD